MTQLTIEDLAADFRSEVARATEKIDRTYELKDLPAYLSVVATHNPFDCKPTSIALVHQALNLRATATGQLDQVETLLGHARQDYDHQVYDTVEMSEAKTLVQHFETALERLRSGPDVDWFTVKYKLTGFRCTSAALTIDYGRGKYGGWGKLDNGKETRYYLDLQSAQKLTEMILPAF